MPLDFSRPVRIELESKARSEEKAMLFIRYLKDQGIPYRLKTGKAGATTWIVNAQQEDHGKP